MLADAQVRLASRLLTFAALVAFVAWIFILYHLMLLLAVAFGVAAYIFFREDLRRNPVDVGTGVGFDTDDRVEEGAETVVSPGLSAAGIPLSFETRSRWRGKR